MRKVALALLVALGVACGGAPLTPEERTARAKCGACHVRPAVGSLDATSWEILLEDHRKRFAISEEEARRLQAYLVTSD